jgi:hypothetical protein
MAILLWGDVDRLIHQTAAWVRGFHFVKQGIRYFNCVKKLAFPRLRFCGNIFIFGWLNHPLSLIYNRFRGL